MPAQSHRIALESCKGGSHGENHDQSQSDCGKSFFHFFKSLQLFLCFASDGGFPGRTRFCAPFRLARLYVTTNCYGRRVFCYDCNKSGVTFRKSENFAFATFSLCCACAAAKARLRAGHIAFFTVGVPQALMLSGEIITFGQTVFLSVFSAHRGAYLRLEDTAHIRQ